MVTDTETTAVRETPEGEDDLTEVAADTANTRTP